MDYIYYHCSGDLVLLAGGDLQEPNLFHQVQLYSHFPELKYNSLTFNATANCLPKKKREGFPRWWFTSDIHPLMAQMTQISKFGKCGCDVHHPRQVLDTVPMERHHVDASHYLAPHCHHPPPLSSWKHSGGGSAVIVSSCARTSPDNFLLPVCVSAVWSVSAPWTESHGLVSVIFAACLNWLRAADLWRQSMCLGERGDCRNVTVV